MIQTSAASVWEIIYELGLYMCCEHLVATAGLTLCWVPAALCWHLNLSVCSWLTDLHCNVNSTDAAPNAIASGLFLHLCFVVTLLPAATLMIIDVSISLLCMCPHRTSLREKDFWEWVYFSITGLGGHWFGSMCMCKCGECVSTNWMNEMICYRNEVKADRRPSGQSNQESRKTRQCSVCECV